MTPLQPQPGLVRVGAVVPLPSRRLRVLPALFDDYQEFHCVPEATVTRPDSPASRRVGHLHVHGLSHLCTGWDEAGKRCDPVVDDDCQKGCFYDERVEVDILAPPGGKTIVIEREWQLPEDDVNGAVAPHLEVDVKVEPDAVTVRGCGQRRTLRI